MRNTDGSIDQPGDAEELPGVYDSMDTFVSSAVVLICMVGVAIAAAIGFVLWAIGG